MTTIEIKPYDLPDKELLNDTGNFRFLIWQPQNTVLVLGQSNNAGTSLNMQTVIREGIYVCKRPSGGETVVLTPNTLVISLTLGTDHFHNPRQYFEQINHCVILALTSLGVKDLAFKGISDIAIGDRKILGSSIYRRKDRVFYHAVLNISEPSKTIERYIKHPTREPIYRKGRPHREFVTSLHDQGYAIPAEILKNEIAKKLHKPVFI